MKKLFGGGVGSVILRSPSRLRTAKVGPFAVPVDWDPPTVPDQLMLIYVTKSLQIRVYHYMDGFPPDLILDVANRLSHGTPGSPRGGWLMNEQVVQSLFDVTLL